MYVVLKNATHALKKMENIKKCKKRFVISKASGALPALIILLLYKLFYTIQARQLCSCIFKMKGREAFLHFNEAKKSSQQRKREPHNKGLWWHV